MIKAFERRIRSAIGRVIPDGDLTQRTAKSGIWAFATNVSSRGMYILMLILVARLLGPKAFGIYSLAILTIAAVTSFTEIGEDEALIQRDEENVDRFLSTIWTIQIGRRLGIAGFLYLTAPYVATLFSEPALTGMLRVMSLGLVARAFRNPAIVYFKKGLRFHKQFLYQVSGSLVQLVVGVWLALVWGNIWALAIAYIATDSTRAIVSYLTHEYRPRPQIDLGLAREVVDYGKWVTGSSILSYLHEQGDDAFVGWLLASASLGWYQLGYRLSNAPATEVSGVISNVMFPAFSKLQNKPAALREAFFKSVRIATFLAFPMGFGVIAVAPTFVNAILGDDWTPMIPAMQVLSVLGILGAVNTQASRLFGAIGRPDYSTKISALRVAATAILIYPATVAAGITGTALVVVGTTLVLVMPIYLYVAINELGTTLRRFVVELSYPLTASVVMLAVVVGTESVLPLPASGLKLVILIGSGVVTYVAVSLLATGLGWEIRDDLEHVYRSVAS